MGATDPKSALFLAFLVSLGVSLPSNANNIRAIPRGSKIGNFRRGGGRRGKAWASKGDRPGKWEVDIKDENKERLESIKAAVLGAVAGSLVGSPIALLSPNRLTPQWEFDHDALAVSLALSALVYRYAIRQDPNPMLKQGVVGAFAITRILSLIKVSDTCTSLPLACGAPLGFADWQMIGEGLFIALESFSAYGGMAVAMEKAFDSGILRRFPSS
ncbi:hypothetical protein AAMO2058_000952200 [Amorphochlora amoebiformis]